MIYTKRETFGVAKFGEIFNNYKQWTNLGSVQAAFFDCLAPQTKPESFGKVRSSCAISPFLRLETLQVLQGYSCFQIYTESR